MNELMVSLQGWGGNTDDFWGGGVMQQKLELAAIRGLRLETSWFGLKNWI